MYCEREGLPSASTRGLEHVQLSGVVRCEECRDDATGLYFWSCLPDSAATPAWARLAFLHGYGEHGGALRARPEMARQSRHLVPQPRLPRPRAAPSDAAGYIRRWDEFLNDLDGFLSWERSRLAKGSPTPLFVLGHSHGGLVAAAAAIAGRLESASGCILSSPYLKARTPLSGPWSAFAQLTSRVAPPDPGQERPDCRK